MLRKRPAYRMDDFMPKKNLRIFIGPSDTARVGSILAGALREKGIKVTLVTWRILPYQAGMKYDVVLNLIDLKGLQKIKLLKYLYHFPKFFLRHNAFVFLFGYSLLPYNLDLPVLKLFRKKTIMWFLGSDIRHYESVEAAVKKMGLKYRRNESRRERPDKVERKKRMIHRVERYVDYIISSPTISHLLTRKYRTIFIPLDIDHIRYNNAPNQRPVVVHAPSNEERKGTSYVLQAIDQLKKEGYDFEFRLFRKMPNTRVREALSKADIAVDQLFATGGGMFALESMAAGCAVLGGNIPELSGRPPGLPIIHTDTDNIYQNLKMLLENPELRRELGEKGRKYVEKYHDYRKITDNILKLLTGDKSNQSAD